MRILSALLCLGLLSAGCAREADRESPSDRLRLAAGLYPLAYVAARVGGPDVTVTDLTPPGAEPHDVELTPGQVAEIERADLVLVVKGLQPAVDAAARDRPALDALTTVSTLGADPHFWLDPDRLAAYALAVANRLGQLDLPRADAYVDRAKELGSELHDLDASFQKGLRGCERRDLVTSHEAFGYLAARYGLDQRGVSGLSPEAEPPPARIAEVTRFVREHRVTTIFFEELVSPKVAETIARETGAKTAVLDPIESGDDYVAAMRGNLAALRTALDCP